MASGRNLADERAIRRQDWHVLANRAAAHLDSEHVSETIAVRNCNENSLHRFFTSLPFQHPASLIDGLALGPGGCLTASSLRQASPRGRSASGVRTRRGRSCSPAGWPSSRRRSGPLSPERRPRRAAGAPRQPPSRPVPPPAVPRARGARRTQTASGSRRSSRATSTSSDRLLSSGPAHQFKGMQVQFSFFDCCRAIA
jgi:hypothetical protein